MNATVQMLLTPYKGILAADESAKTIEKRFLSVGLQSTDESRKNYRSMLFSTPDLEKYISGVILFDETIKQGLGQLLTQKGILIGIKVDEGLEDFNNTEEQVTKGLDGLSERLEEYKKINAVFTKWRAVFKISDIFPTDLFLDETLGRMAKYAKIVQEKQMTPIVEPEVLLDGNHTTTRCELVMTKVLKRMFELFQLEGIDLNNLIVKSSMVLPGKDSGVHAMPLEVAGATLRAFENSIPKEVPGIVFLSGGQTPDDATFNLNEIVKTKNKMPNLTWDISFSYSRALQEEALKVWSDNELIKTNENISKAQEAFMNRLQKVSKARMGEL